VSVRRRVSPSAWHARRLLRTIAFRVLSGPLLALLEWTAIKVLVLSLAEDLHRLRGEFQARLEGQVR
jgi:hypothetical protein